MAYCHAVGDFRPLAHPYPIVGKLTFVVTEHANAVTIYPLPSFNYWTYPSYLRQRDVCPGELSLLRPLFILTEVGFIFSGHRSMKFSSVGKLRRVSYLYTER